MMKGTVGGGGGFRLLDARFIGTPITNPTNSYYVSIVSPESLERTASVFDARHLCKAFVERGRLDMLRSRAELLHPSSSEPLSPHAELVQVGSTALESWSNNRYPDFVAEGSADQSAIMEAICAVKKATFDGVDCEDGDPTATGTVRDVLMSLVSSTILRRIPLIFQFGNTLNSHSNVWRLVDWSRHMFFSIHCWV